MAILPDFELPSLYFELNAASVALHNSMPLDDPFDGQCMSAMSSACVSQPRSAPAESQSQDVLEKIRPGWETTRDHTELYRSPTGVLWRLCSPERPYIPKKDNKDSDGEPQPWHVWQFLHNKEWVLWNPYDEATQKILDGEDLVPIQFELMKQREYEWAKESRKLVDEYVTKHSETCRRIVSQERTEKRERRQAKADKAFEQKMQQLLSEKEARQAEFDIKMRSRAFRIRHIVHSVISTPLRSLGRFLSRVQVVEEPTRVWIPHPASPLPDDEPVAEYFRKKLSLALLDLMDDFNSQGANSAFALRQGIPREMLEDREIHWCSVSAQAGEANPYHY